MKYAVLLALLWVSTAAAVLPDTVGLSDTTGVTATSVNRAYANLFEIHTAETGDTIIEIGFFGRASFNDTSQLILGIYRVGAGDTVVGTMLDTAIIEPFNRNAETSKWWKATGLAWGMTAGERYCATVGRDTAAAITVRVVTGTSPAKSSRDANHIPENPWNNNNYSLTYLVEYFIVDTTGRGGSPPAPDTTDAVHHGKQIIGIGKVR